MIELAKINWKQVLTSAMLYLIAGVAGVGVGTMLPDSTPNPYRPAVMEALSEIPSRIVLVESGVIENSRYNVLVDQSTGDAYLWFRHGLVRLEEAPAPASLEDMFE